MLLFTVLFAYKSTAQNVIRQVPCSNESIKHQADSIKQEFANQGFIVVKEASMTMESEYEMPVIVPAFHIHFPWSWKLLLLW